MSPPSATRWAVGLSVSWLLMALRTEAAPPPARRPVLLSVAPCVELDEQALSERVALELETRLVDEAASDAETTRCQVGCTEHALELRVRATREARPLQRSIDDGALASAVRVRVLAVAIAELVEASWAERAEREARQRPPAVAPGEGPASPFSHDAAMLGGRAASPRPGLRIEGLFGGRAFPTAAASAFLLGGGVRVAGSMGSHHLAWVVDLVGEHGSTSQPLGAAAMNLIDGSAMLLWEQEGGPITVSGGVGVRMGAAQIAGESAMPEVKTADIWGPWGGPVASGAVRATLGRRVVLGFGAEAGYTLLEVAGLVGATRGAAVEGIWLAGQLSLGWVP